VRIRSVFGTNYDEVAAKLLNDVCKFLVSAGELREEFRTQAHAILIDMPTIGDDDEESPAGHVELPSKPPPPQ
jgi:hypothetical protein